jgi:hypothetical protein
MRIVLLTNHFLTTEKFAIRLDHPVKRYKASEKLPDKPARPFPENITPVTQAGMANPAQGVQPMEIKQEAVMNVSRLC